MFAILEYMIYIIFIVILLNLCSGKRQPLRVYGGEDADLEAYPYVVRLEIRRTKNLANGSMIDKLYHFCTASALSSTWALTAAHCIKNINIMPKILQTDRVVVRYGSVHSSPNDENTFSDVLLMIMHPMYTFRQSVKGELVKNDIGLIKTKPMQLNRFIKLSPVDFHTLYGHEAVFGGFGLTTIKISNNETKIGTTLGLKMPLQIFKVLINKCNKEPGTGPSLCLGHRCGSIITVCGGDSGGPVIHSTGIVGVLSTGFGNMYCGDKTINTASDAGTHCPVGPYIEWIASYVNN